MHEIRATIPPERVAETIQIAHLAGIERVSVSEVYVHGPDSEQRIVSVETSTPKACVFVEWLLKSSVLSGPGCSLTSREVRSILGAEPLPVLTQPMSEPFPDVVQDLWQLSHLTPSYLGRATAGAALMATGVIENSSIAIVVAALFLPFLSQALAVNLGLWSRDRGLMWHGIRALLASTALALVGGAAVAWMEGGPIRFDGFRGPVTSLIISAAIGTAAGLASADDAGRRYLIGVAAAVQFAIFPVWLGAALVIGLPSRDVVNQRLVSFLVSLTAMSLTALLAYAGLTRGALRSKVGQ